MTVYFSGKISNSILTFLDREGVSLDGLYDLTDLPMEFLRDPSCWLEAEKLEKFLQVMDHTFGLRFNDNFVSIVGLKSVELRSWGVLDSVLKMIETPADIYGQPQRLLSYFVSPEPPIANLNVEERKVSFELPITNDEYPYVGEYIKAAIEGLPKYIDKNPSTVRWIESKMEISWTADQPALLDAESLRKSLSPDLLQSMVKSLEGLQKEVEKKNEELSFRDKEIARLKQDIQNLLKTPVNRKFNPNLGEQAVMSEEILQSTEILKGEIAKLSDYIARAQQLVTLLVGRGRLDTQAKMAMRRVGWDQVMQGKVLSVRQSLALVESIERFANNEAQPESSNVETQIETPLHS